MKEVLTYDDVLLVPQYSDIRSRAEVLLHTNLGNKLSLDFPAQVEVASNFEGERSDDS